MTRGDDMQAIDAQLDHIRLGSRAPDRLAAFFDDVLGMTRSRLAHDKQGEWQCRARDRTVLVTPSETDGLSFAAYSFAEADRLAEYRARIERSPRLNGQLAPNPSPLFDERAFAVCDPDGNTIVFGVKRNAAGSGRFVLPGRLQHLVMRTTHPEEMVAFYTEALGFIASDKVLDGEGMLRACFMRSDVEHHSFACFRSSEARLDHHSYETNDWARLRDWADHMSERATPIFWGVGRHGPGDDLFFMVKDPDNNLVEISAEIEQCGIDRPMGVWPHEERTLNVWGNAIMRS